MRRKLITPFIERVLREAPDVRHAIPDDFFQYFANGGVDNGDDVKYAGLANSGSVPLGLPDNWVPEKERLGLEPMLDDDRAASCHSVYFTDEALLRLGEANTEEDSEGSVVVTVGGKSTVVSPGMKTSRLIATSPRELRAELEVFAGEKEREVKFAIRTFGVLETEVRHPDLKTCFEVFKSALSFIETGARVVPRDMNVIDFFGLE
jgi:hypothetical protein